MSKGPVIGSEIEVGRALGNPTLGKVVGRALGNPTVGRAVGIAVCTPLAGVNLEDAEIKQWLRDKVARYKQPKSFIFWGNLPKSGYGKIDKKAIRAELITSGLIETKELRK